MKKTMIDISITMGVLLVLLSGVVSAQDGITGEEIVRKVDKNLFSETRKSELRMIVHGERNQRELSLRAYSAGSEKSFTEFLSPERERGIKMLKLETRLWIYSPDTDRTIQLSGHLLRQSMMGSDISYEDMMEERKLLNIYSVEVTGTGELSVKQGDGRVARRVWELELTAKVEDINYARRKVWVDQEYFLPLQEELYAKGGILLKRLTYGDLARVGDRWTAKHLVYKDVLKSGEGTEIIVDAVEFDPLIPPHIFSKASLRR